MKERERERESEKERCMYKSLTRNKIKPRSGHTTLQSIEFEENKVNERSKLMRPLEAFYPKFKA